MKAALPGIGGVLWQIPGHDESEMDHAAMDQGEVPLIVEPPGPYTTVALDVAGMT